MRHTGWMRRRLRLWRLRWLQQLLGFNGCNCGRSVGYAPSPLYVVNQGPEYSGPGMMVPYRPTRPARLSPRPSTIPTSVPATAIVGPAIYRSRLSGPRYAYGAHATSIRAITARGQLYPLTGFFVGKIDKGPLRAGLCLLVEPLLLTWGESGRQAHAKSTRQQHIAKIIVVALNLGRVAT